jgi:hypothetical protein
MLFIRTAIFIEPPHGQAIVSRTLFKWPATRFYEKKGNFQDDPFRGVSAEPKKTAEHTQGPPFRQFGHLAERDPASAFPRGKYYLVFLTSYF